MDWSFSDYIPPYYYDTEDFEQIRKAYASMDEYANIAVDVLDTVTTPAKWSGEVLDDMLTMLGFGRDLPYLNSDDEKRELMYTYFKDLRLMTDDAFIWFVNWSMPQHEVTRYFADRWSGRNTTDGLITHTEGRYTPKATIKIHRGRNMYVNVSIPDWACEESHSTTLGYDVLMDHISEIFPIGVRLQLDVNMEPVGEDNIINVGAVSANTDEQFSETGEIANIYNKHWLVWVDRGNETAATSTQYEWDDSTNKYYITNIGDLSPMHWMSESELNALTPRSSIIRPGYRVDMGVPVNSISNVAIPEDIQYNNNIALGLEWGMTDRAGAILRISTSTGPTSNVAAGDWTWLNGFVSYTLTYDATANQTSGFPASRFIYIDLRNNSTSTNAITMPRSSDKVGVYAANRFMLPVYRSGTNLILNNWTISTNAGARLYVYGDNIPNRTGFIIYDSTDNAQDIPFDTITQSAPAVYAGEPLYVDDVPIEYDGGVTVLRLTNNASDPIVVSNGTATYPPTYTADAAYEIPVGWSVETTMLTPEIESSDGYMYDEWLYAMENPTGYLSESNSNLMDKEIRTYNAGYTIPHNPFKED